MQWGQLSLQNAGSPLIFQLDILHDFAILTLIIISAYVSYIIYLITKRSTWVLPKYENHTLETLWTISPAIILIILALPSLRLLYLLDELSSPHLTIKTIGHQWYWSYEYSDFINIEFDSYIIPTEDLKEGQLRLLEVDNRLVVPLHTEARLLVTAADVIHAWTVPSIGIKADAIPGRLNQLTILPFRPGVFYGQCSEICGANHSFMPIALEVVPIKYFKKWVLRINELYV